MCLLASCDAARQKVGLSWWGQLYGAACVGLLCATANPKHTKNWNKKQQRQLFPLFPSHYVFCIYSEVLCLPKQLPHPFSILEIKEKVDFFLLPFLAAVQEAAGHFRMVSQAARTWSSIAGHLLSVTAGCCPGRDTDLSLPGDGCHPFLTAGLFWQEMECSKAGMVSVGLPFLLSVVYDLWQSPPRECRLLSTVLVHGGAGTN